MKTKKCKVCGLIAPADDFPKGRCICKECKRKKDVEYKREWRKTHTEKKRIKTAEEWREYREKLKTTRGNTYPSDEYAEKRRIYQREYAKKHKDDEVFKQKQRERSRRYRELLKERKLQDGRNMSRIRIPRRKKKWHYRDKTSNRTFPYVSKYYRYVCYFCIERGIKQFNMTAEELYKSFGRYTVDHIVWWHWVRRKHLHIEPKLSGEFQEYWDYFVSEGVIK